jgi:hypothetical protein
MVPPPDPALGPNPEDRLLYPKLEAAASAAGPENLPILLSIESTALRFRETYVKKKLPFFHIDENCTDEGPSTKYLAGRALFVARLSGLRIADLMEELMRALDESRTQTAALTARALFEEAGWTVYILEEAKRISEGGSPKPEEMLDRVHSWGRNWNLDDFLDRVTLGGFFDRSVSMTEGGADWRAHLAEEYAKAVDDEHRPKASADLKLPSAATFIHRLRRSLKTTDKLKPVDDSRIRVWMAYDELCEYCHPASGKLFSFLSSGGGQKVFGGISWLFPDILFCVDLVSTRAFSNLEAFTTFFSTLPEHSAESQVE